MRLVAKKAVGKESVVAETEIDEAGKSISVRMVMKSGSEELLTWEITIRDRKAKFSAVQKGLTNAEMAVAGSMDLAGSEPRFSEIFVMGVPVSPVPGKVGDLDDHPSIMALVKGKDVKLHKNFKATLLSLQQLQEILSNGFDQGDVQTQDGGKNDDLLKNYMLMAGCIGGCLAAYTIALGAIALSPATTSPFTIGVTITAAFLAYMSCIIGCQYAFVVRQVM